MTINNESRDEKLQDDINREAAKISALSSSKTYNYKYLTGEDILPSYRQQLIEQARFTYSRLGKEFEKQIKTIGYQKKEIKAIKDQGQFKTIKKYAGDTEDTPLIAKQKEIFVELVDESLQKITDVNRKVNSDDLIYRFKGNTSVLNVGKFNNAFVLIDKIRM